MAHNPFFAKQLRQLVSLIIFCFFMAGLMFYFGYNTRIPDLAAACIVLSLLSLVSGCMFINEYRVENKRYKEWKEINARFRENQRKFGNPQVFTILFMLFTTVGYSQTQEFSGRFERAIQYDPESPFPEEIQGIHYLRINLENREIALIDDCDSTHATRYIFYDRINKFYNEEYNIKVYSDFEYSIVLVEYRDMTSNEEVCPFYLDHVWIMNRPDNMAIFTDANFERSLIIDQPRLVWFNHEDTENER